MLYTYWFIYAQRQYISLCILYRLCVCVWACMRVCVYMWVHVRVLVSQYECHMHTYACVCLCVRGCLSIRCA